MLTDKVLAAAYSMRNRYNDLVTFNKALAMAEETLKAARSKRDEAQTAYDRSNQYMSLVVDKFVKEPRFISK